ncbi:MAG TPA: hypothetical protein VNE39_13440 [Planctomycetota bacterium]|nr:hypothetical protein [Planctomycetota bacterium]
MKTAWFPVLGLLVAAVVHAGALEVKPDKENVVASRLCGKWVVEPKLSQRLTAGVVDRESPSGKIEFASDPAVAGKLPEKYLEFLKDKRIYMAGTMKSREKDCPFILIEHCGNPHVVWFRERDGDPMGDAESFNVILAVAKNPIDDLLFIGGDFNNQPFRALERAERAEAK